MKYDKYKFIFIRYTLIDHKSTPRDARKVREQVINSLLITLYLQSDLRDLTLSLTLPKLNSSRFNSEPSTKNRMRS